MACWSKGSNARHPYYLCPKRGCASYGKSIRRDRIESEFEELLRSVQPKAALFSAAHSALKKLREHQLCQADAQAKALSAELVKIERQVSQFLERFLDASVPSVIAAYEERIAKLEREKLVIDEKRANASRPASSFDDTLRTALDFISSPWNLWKSERLEDRRTVLKLTFADRLHYMRNEGFRTASLSLPFNVLGKICGMESEMAPRRGIKIAMKNT